MQSKLLSFSDFFQPNLQQDLTSFKDFQHYNLFLFSRNSHNVPSLLLHNLLGELTFSHFHGDLTKHDPAIFFSIARDFVTKTEGLLCSDNLQYFRADDPLPLKHKNLVLEKVSNGSPIRPQKGFSKAVNDICRLLSETPYIYQDDDTVSYFVEIPMLNLKAIHKVAEDRDIGIRFKYASFAEIEMEEESIDRRVISTCLQDPSLGQYIEQYIIEKEEVVVKEHYAIIACDARAVDYMFRSLHYSMFKKQGEDWRYYKAWENDLPTDEELIKLKGILIPGSRNAAYSTSFPWYKELFECIVKVHTVFTHINLLGICFGAQVIAQALGGKVASMGRFIGGGEVLRVRKEFYSLEYVKNADIDKRKQLVITESHGDQIVKLPEGAVCLASSGNTNVEIYVKGSKVLAFQGHPDYNKAWLSGAYYRNFGTMEADYDKYAERIEREKFDEDLTQKELVEICYKFLKKDEARRKKKKEEV